MDIGRDDIIDAMRDGFKYDLLLRDVLVELLEEVVDLDRESLIRGVTERYEKKKDFHEELAEAIARALRRELFDKSTGHSLIEQLISRLAENKLFQEVVARRANMARVASYSRAAAIVWDRMSRLSDTAFEKPY